MKRFLLLVAVLILVSCVPVPVKPEPLPLVFPTATSLPTPTPTITPQPKTCLVVVAAEALNVRRDPTYHSPALGWVYHGDIVYGLETIGSNRNWWRLESGYVNAKFVKECEDG